MMRPGRRRAADANRVQRMLIVHMCIYRVRACACLSEAFPVCMRACISPSEQGKDSTWPTALCRVADMRTDEAENGRLEAAPPACPDPAPAEPPEGTPTGLLARSFRVAAVR